MKGIIAEKPSVAMEIAGVLGVKNKKEGYLEGNGYLVTWAFGHLVTIAPPESYGIKSLPIIPNKFKLVARREKTDKGYQADKGAMRQLKIIKEVFSKCDEIIVATDAGREGELIFRLIYDYLECTKPFKRLWISSLTEKTIRDGLQNLKPGSDYDSLYVAAKARSEADWLIGINASRALSEVAGDYNNSLGRVQTPTLSMVCQRYAQFRNFKPEPYWVFKAGIEKDGILFRLNAVEKFTEKQKANDFFKKLEENKNITITKIERKEKKEQPPLLYDLTALQQDANKLYGYTAEETLSLAQKLYEAKHITYPRTGSRYIPEEMVMDIYVLVTGMWGKPIYGMQAVAIHNGDPATINRHSVDDTKITDHHAIIVTDNFPTSLHEDERVIYELISARVIEAFSDECIKEILTIQAESPTGMLFETKGTKIKKQGWRAVWRSEEEKEENEDEQKLPKLSDGESFTISCINMLEKATKPKPLFTDATLLDAMEKCGKQLENEDERRALDGSGIGTPATRAAIIETLIKRGYMERIGKNLEPTRKGLELYQAVKNMQIANVALTGNWESKLEKMVQNPETAESFNEEIRAYTRQVTDEIYSIRLPESEVTIFCPKCRLGKISMRGKIAKCPYSKCNLTIFRNISGKTLTEGQMTELLKKKRTGLIKGFKSKKGAAFDAVLKFDDDFNVVFEFPNTGKK